MGDGAADIIIIDGEREGGWSVKDILCIDFAIVLKGSLSENGFMKLDTSLTKAVIYIIIICLLLMNYWITKGYEALMSIIFALNRIPKTPIDLI